MEEDDKEQWTYETIATFGCWCALWVDTIPQLLREYFYKRWQEQFAVAWSNDTASGDKLMDKMPQSKRKGFFQDQKDLLGSGNSTNWDLTLLTAVLLDCPNLIDVTPFAAFKCNSGCRDSAVCQKSKNFAHWPRSAKRSIIYFREMRNERYAHLTRLPRLHSIFEECETEILEFCGKNDIECPPSVGKNVASAKAIITYEQELNRELDNLLAALNEEKPAKPSAQCLNAIKSIRQLMRVGRNKARILHKSPSQSSLRGYTEKVMDGLARAFSRLHVAWPGISLRDVSSISDDVDSDRSRANTPRTNSHREDSPVAAALYICDRDATASWEADVISLLRSLFHQGSLTLCSLVIAIAMRDIRFLDPDAPANWESFCERIAGGASAHTLSTDQKEQQLFARAEKYVRNAYVALDWPGRRSDTHSHSDDFSDTADSTTTAASRRFAIEEVREDAASSSAGPAPALRLRTDHGGILMVDETVRYWIRASRCNCESWVEDVIERFNADAARRSARGAGGEEAMGDESADMSPEEQVSLYAGLANSKLQRLTVNGTRLIHKIDTMSYAVFLRMRPEAAAILHARLRTDAAAAAVAAEYGITMAAFGCESLPMLRLRMAAKNGSHGSDMAARSRGSRAIDTNWLPPYVCVTEPCVQSEEQLDVSAMSGGGSDSAIDWQEDRTDGGSSSYENHGDGVDGGSGAVVNKPREGLFTSWLRVLGDALDLLDSEYEALSEEERRRCLEGLLSKSLETIERRAFSESSFSGRTADSAGSSACHQNPASDSKRPRIVDPSQNSSVDQPVAIKRPKVQESPDSSERLQLVGESQSLPKTSPSISTRSTLKKVLKYCQEVAIERNDARDNVLDSVFFYGQDIHSIQIKSEEEFFSVAEIPSHARTSMPKDAVDRQQELYYDLFDRYRKNRSHGEQVLCGMGIIRKHHEDQSKQLTKIWHPVIVLVVDIEDHNGRLTIRQSALQDPALWPMSSEGILEASILEELNADFKMYLTELESQNRQITPMNKDTYQPFLKRVSKYLRADLQDTHERPCKGEDDILKYWKFVKHNKLEMFDDWVLFSQEAGPSDISKAFQGYIGCLENNEYSIPPWAESLAAKLNKIKTPQFSHEMISSQDDGDILFPLPSNDQQREIAELLRQNHTVVVQGPPGTGKTHTLANLVSNALAEGKRMLVLSTGQDALDAFMAKLPACIKKFAMYLVDEKEQSCGQLTTAMMSILSIIQERKGSGWKVNLDAQQQQNEKEQKRCQRLKQSLENLLKFRGDLMLLPLSQDLKTSFELRAEHEKAITLRNNIAVDYAGKELCCEGLGSLIECLCSTEEKFGKAEWLDDLSAKEQEGLRNFLSTEVIPALKAVFEQDLFKEFLLLQQRTLKCKELSTELRVKAHLASHIPSEIATAATTFRKEFTEARSKGRGHQARHWKTVKDVMKDDPLLVKALPLWVMTTRMVFDLMPSIIGLFDVVAIDEASKSGMCELPALLLGEKVLIIGDNKQVSPNDLHLKEARLQELEQVRQSFTDSVTLRTCFAPDKSIFDLFFSLHVDNVKILREHFRCTLPIIKFCNDNFYDRELEPLRISKKEERLLPQIKCTNMLVSGSVKAEIENLVKEVRNLLSFVFDMKAMIATFLEQVKSIVEDFNAGKSGNSETGANKKTIGVIVLGIGQESVALSKRISKELKLQLGDSNYKKYGFRCGGPADFQGDEKHIIFALLPTKRRLVRVNISRWDQAINVAVSRARERFHLLHMVPPEEVARGEDTDPRKKLILYCEEFVKEFDPAANLRQLSGLEGFANKLAQELCFLGFDIRTCNEILSDDWKNKVLVVEGSRMIAIVVNGSRFQTADMYHEECKKWGVLSRIDWKVIECWYFLFVTDRGAFLSRLVEELKLEGALPQVKSPQIFCEGSEPFSDSVRVILNAEKGCKIFYTLDDSDPSSASHLYQEDSGIVIGVGVRILKAIAVREGCRDSDLSLRKFTVISNSEQMSDEAMCEYITPLHAPFSMQPTIGAQEVNKAAAWTKSADSSLLGSFKHEAKESDCLERVIMQTESLPSSSKQSACPYFEPSGGRYQGTVSVSIHSSEVGACIHYTLDGSEPTPSSVLYTGPFDLSVSTAAIRAIAVAEGRLPSPVVCSKRFRIQSTQLKKEEAHDSAIVIVDDEDKDDTPAMPTPAAQPTQPTFMPDGGSYSSPVKVEIRWDKQGEIHYTLDGTEPRQDSPRYMDSLVVGPDRCVLRAVVIHNGRRSAITVSREFRFWWCRLEPVHPSPGLPQEALDAVRAAVPPEPIEVGLLHHEFLFCRKPPGGEPPDGWYCIVNDHVISTQHCCIQRIPGAGADGRDRVELRAFKTKNRTLVNGKRVPDDTPEPLKDGDCIALSPNMYTKTTGGSRSIVHDKSLGELFAWTIRLPQYP